MDPQGAEEKQKKKEILNVQTFVYENASESDFSL